MKRAGEEKVRADASLPSGWQTRDLEKKLNMFPAVLERAMKDLSPHYIVTYLTELSAIFNTFYADEIVVSRDDPSSPYKVALTSAFSIVLENGLNILGIQVPEKM